MTSSEKPAPQAMKEAVEAIATEQRVITASLTALETHLRSVGAQPDTALLLADCRDTITEGLGALHSQGADVLHALQLLQAPAAPVQPGWRPAWIAAGSGCLAGLLLTIAVFIWAWPDVDERRFLVALDAVVVTHYPRFPAVAQDAFTSLYGEYQFQPPGKRQQKGAK